MCRADVLSDEASRALYNKYGLEGMGRHGDVAGGRGNASKAWDEFKPHKRENKRTRARGASATAFSVEADNPEAASGSGIEVAADGEYVHL